MDPSTLLASWLDGGRAKPSPGLGVTLEARPSASLPRKLRDAYAWITERAVVCTQRDIGFGEQVSVGRGESRVELRGSSFSSFALLPLLTLVTSQRLLFVGAPGGGKTTMATLMARVAGMALDEVRRSVQHGHPQLTITDLLGSPLPSELLRVEQADRIRVSWRRWIGARVKIIDEYNRIPTKTQSALLSLMAEGYAEMFEQVVYAGRSSWFLTANDDLGGGTFPVIEALKDRIDVVVRCAPFSGRRVGDLSSRLVDGRTPEGQVPSDIVFSPEELERAEGEIRAIPVDSDVEEILGFFAGQLGFCRRASDALEFRNKDTLHLSGRRVGHVCTEDCPLDKQVHLCTQTENGVSARALQSILLFAKALAYFRGEKSAGVADVHQVLPFVLLEKLRPNPQSAFFQKTENEVLLLDRIGWIRRLFESAIAQHAAYGPVQAPVRALEAGLRAGGLRLPVIELKKRLAEVQQRLEELLRRSELGGAVHDDLLVLKDIHARYQSELAARRGAP